MLILCKILNTVVDIKDERRGDRECVQHTENFFSNIFSTPLLEPVDTGPVDTEGWLHWLRHGAAEGMVVKTWSLQADGKETMIEHASNPLLTR